MIRKIAFAGIAFALLIGSNCYADTLVFDAAADNTIYQDSTGNSNGAGDFLFAGNNGGNSPRRSLINFDLSAIPTGATITNVTFTAFVSQGNGTTVDIDLHRLTNDWGESTSDAPGGEGGGTSAAIGDATWDENFFGTSNWTNPGADFIVGSSATASVGTSGSHSWSSAGLVSDVQDWVDGSAANFGWILIGDESGPSTARRFNSRTNANNSPFLTIEFESIPEPATGLLLAAALLSCGTIRRRLN